MRTTTTLPSGDVSVTNLDNDGPGVSVSAISGDTTEAGGQATFSVVLQSQPSGTVTVALASSNTGEGTVSPDALVFTPANWNTPQTVTVTGVEDDVDDGNVAYTIVTTVSSDAPPLPAVPGGGASSFPGGRGGGRRAPRRRRPPPALEPARSRVDESDVRRGGENGLVGRKLRRRGRYEITVHQ